MKPSRTQIAFWILIGVAAVLAVTIYFLTLPPPFGKYDALAKCIANTSTTFYGAFWCPHCQDQKRAFGDAAQYLPYVECSTPDAQHETPVCVAAGVHAYPTWQFPDGSRASGDQSMQTLSEKTGCALPTSS